jgi:hypothetical protein
LGAGGRGVSERVAVTAASLARELNVRLDNAVSGGVGISISQNLIELPGGDPTDPADDILSYTISAGLPGNTDTVGFAGLTLGALQAQGAQPVTSIVNAISKTATTSVRQLRLVTEEGLFTPGWIRAAQVEDNTLTLGKIQTISDFRVLGRSNTGASGNVQQVTVRTSVRASPSDDSLVTEKAVADKVATVPSIKGWMKINSAGNVMTRGGVLSGASSSFGFFDTGGNGTNGATYTITIPSGAIPVSGDNMVVTVSAQDPGEADHSVCLDNVSPTQIRLKTVDLEFGTGGVSASTVGFAQSIVHILVMY